MNSTFQYSDRHESFFGYRIYIKGIIVKEVGFGTEADAGWAADKARRLLTPFIGKSRPYNFPDRVQQMTESEMGSLSDALLAFYHQLCLAFPSALAPALAVSPAPAAAPAPKRVMSVTQRADLQAQIAVASHKRDCLLAAATNIRAAFGAYPEGRLGTTVTYLSGQAARLDIEVFGLEKQLPAPVVSPLDTETT
jgi:hypothetical protein